jgi:hypothetical protein
VTVSPRAVSVGFGSVLGQIPRIRFGSVFGTSLECTAFSALKIAKGLHIICLYGIEISMMTQPTNEKFGTTASCKGRPTAVT